MKFRSDEGIMMDAWHLNQNDRIHFFHLKTVESDLPFSVGHIYTDDLLHFTKCEDILPVLPEEEYPEDCLSKYTGCAFTAPDGMHYIYYTMRNKYEAQKIGVALSADLENFTLYEKNPVLVPDREIFLYGDGKQREDCRDMLVVYDEKSAKYYGYFAAMSEENDRKFGVVGVAESNDLLSWSNQEIVYRCDFDGVIEVPDVFFLDGKWYLTMLTHSSFGAKYAFSDKNVVSGTIYAVSDSPKGPFILGYDNVFIGGTYGSGFTCRSFDYKGKKYLSYIDKSEYGWSISLPKEIKVIDGKLRPCYTPILEKLRKNTLVSSLSKDTLTRHQGTLLWDTASGEVIENDAGLILQPNHQSFLSCMLNSPKASGVEICYSFTLDEADGGVVIEVARDAENMSKFFAVASSAEKNFTLYSDDIFFNASHRRSFDFENNKKYNARIFVWDGVLEVYINDMLLMQNSFQTSGSIGVGLFAGGGKCTFEDFCVYELLN